MDIKKNPHQKTNRQNQSNVFEGRGFKHYFSLDQSFTAVYVFCCVSCFCFKKLEEEGIVCDALRFLLFSFWSCFLPLGSVLAVTAGTLWFVASHLQVNVFHKSTVSFQGDVWQQQFRWRPWQHHSSYLGSKTRRNCWPTVRSFLAVWIYFTCWQWCVPP